MNEFCLKDIIRRNYMFLLLLSISFFSAVFISSTQIDHAQGEMSGEPTQTTILLQSRLTQGNHFIDGDIVGASGVACFEFSKSLSFRESFTTDWIHTLPENDFIVRQKISDLKPGTMYYYRLLFGPDKEHISTGNTCSFKTLPDTSALSRVSFVVVTGMNYDKFHYGWPWKNREPYGGADKILGYPALETILKLKPDIFVGTGDNVYYDELGVRGAAKTQAELRRKWHEQFVQKRYIDLFTQTPAFWEKDDHDYRYNDCDTTGTHLPLHGLGKKTFLEQMPVIDPEDPNTVTYRTHRVGKLLQIWLLEGRDYRSPNSMPDGPQKSIWGEVQKEWLKKTLLASTATFKLVISPTPMVGPDDGYKSDNHTNPKGFKQEGDAFFSWLKANGFLNKHFYLVCGDRHWQYHSIHPTGFEEFSCGALVENNSRLGRAPGDPESTDPQALVKQIYTQKEASAGFLKISVIPGTQDEPHTLSFNFYDEYGNLLYACQKISLKRLEGTPSK
jgi:alkaline phosphatase D